MRPPTTPSEPATLHRPDLEVLHVHVAAPAEPVPFVRHVEPETGSSAARRPVPVPLRSAPDAVPVEDATGDDPAPRDDVPVFTASDVLPGPPPRRGFLSRFRSGSPNPV